jgi:hypothetical protein
VGDNDEGARVVGGQRLEELDHRFGRALIQIACRLVGENQLRPVGERPGDRDSLSLST